MHFGLTGLLPLALYVAAIVVFLASIFWRPEVGIWFIVPLFPLQTIRYKLLPYPLGNKLIDMILLGVILGILFRRDFKLFPKTPLNKFLLAFAAVLYVSLLQGAFYLGFDLPLWIGDPRFSIWKNYMIMPLIFILVVSVIKERQEDQDTCSAHVFLRSAGEQEHLQQRGLARPVALFIRNARGRRFRLRRREWRGSLRRMVRGIPPGDCGI